MTNSIIEKFNALDKAREATKVAEDELYNLVAPRIAEMNKYKREELDFGVMCFARGFEIPNLMYYDTEPEFSRKTFFNYEIELGKDAIIFSKDISTYSKTTKIFKFEWLTKPLDELKYEMAKDVAEYHFSQPELFIFSELDRRIEEELLEHNIGQCKFVSEYEDDEDLEEYDCGCLERIENWKEKKDKAMKLKETYGY